MKHWFAAVLAASALAANAAEEDALQKALNDAKARQAPVFVDFYALWCHSCFFMDKHVLTGPEWESVKQRAVTVMVDGDSPEGSARVQEYEIKGYPTYLVLAPDGTELGRILGDKPRDQFYAELNPLLERGAALDTWKARVDGTGPEAIAAARMVLKSYYERMDYATAIAWLASLPAPVREAIVADAEAKDLHARLTLLAHAEDADAPACLAAAPAVLGGPLACDRLVEMSGLQECLAGLPEEERRRHLRPYAAKMAALQSQVLVAGKGVCNDTRGIVDTAADLYEALGDEQAYEQVFRQGVAHAERALGGDYARDHHLADNMRYYLERVGDNERLDELFPKLIATYPDTYDYYYRYGKNLVKRGLAAKALPYLEQAYEKSYGRNRLWVAQWRAQALMELDRGDEARALVAETLQANGPWFERDVAVLKAVLAGQAPA